MSRKITIGEWCRRSTLHSCWLAENGRSAGDVMITEDGREYVYSEMDEEGRYQKIYLPSTASIHDFTVESFI